MSKPHGGKLVNRYIKKESYDTRDIPEFEINTNLSEDIINIANGVFSPLEGFLNYNDLENVVTEKRLADDTPWTIPILLDLDKNDIKEGDSVLLSNKEKLPHRQKFHVLSSKMYKRFFQHFQILHSLHIWNLFQHPPMLLDHNTGVYADFAFHLIR